jgi:hypothetical protein
MPVSVALSMLTPAALMKERPLPPHSRLSEVCCVLDFLIPFFLFRESPVFSQRC